MLPSVFDLFKLGVGPSSSHTMGPMTAAVRLLSELAEAGRLAQVTRVEVTLYGSLALTGRGHATDRAVLLGLLGFLPATLDADAAEVALEALRATGRLPLGAASSTPGPEIAFAEAEHLLWEGMTRLPRHPNALRFRVTLGDGDGLVERIFYSLGGGFVADDRQMDANTPVGDEVTVPYPFTSAAELLAMADGAGLTIAEVMMANETALRPRADVEAGLDQIFEAMDGCIERGVRQTGVLPGGLNVRRRARGIYEDLKSRAEQHISDPLIAMDWINLWALAVNEENAAGGRVVTAPTNGAAGIVPAVLRYYDRFHRGGVEARRRFLLTAGAVGALYKRNASISGAEVGCQGEVGVACSMAAAGFAAAMGATNAQIENAAEIAMEHNLGLTCDPIGGLVQIPCIERNAMGAIKAIDAA
ncbi:MAG: L-serine ammonia-lyase, partial [Thermoleophilia bacterium]|nr:L-serine ammonia-lyase [Thermoleophilia bacterium]